MGKVNISVTDAVRNFSSCVGRVRYQNVTFVLLKNGSPVAHLAPANDKVCTGRELAAALAKNELSDDEAVAWRRDLQDARKILKAPKSKWR